MKKLKNTNKGITLIALVITIIVMLILVAVTISMAVNGGLFEYASNAGAQTNGAIANEQELAKLEANMTVDQLIDKYTKGSSTTKYCEYCDEILDECVCMSDDDDDDDNLCGYCGRLPCVCPVCSGCGELQIECAC